mgnify:FL=1
MGAVVMKWTLACVLVLCAVCRADEPHKWSTAQVREVAVVLMVGESPALRPEWEDAFDSLWDLAGVEFDEHCALYEARLSLVFQAVQLNMLGWSDERLLELRVMREAREEFACPGLARATLVVIGQLGLHAMAAGELEYGRALYRDVIRSEHLDARSRGWIMLFASAVEPSVGARRGLTRGAINIAEEADNVELLVGASFLGLLVIDDQMMRERMVRACREKARDAYGPVVGGVMEIMVALMSAEEDTKQRVPELGRSILQAFEELEAPTEQEVLAVAVAAATMQRVDEQLALSMLRLAAEHAGVVFEKGDRQLQGVYLALGRQLRAMGIEEALPEGTPDPAIHRGTANFGAGGFVSPWSDEVVGGVTMRMEWGAIESEDGAG